MNEGGGGLVYRTERQRVAMSEAQKRSYRENPDRPKGGSHAPKSEETKLKISETQKRRYLTETHPRTGAVLSEETKRKIGEANKGNESPFKGKIHSEESKKKQREIKLGKSVFSTRKSYSFISPNGEIFDFIGLKQFCEIHNLSTANMSSVHSGKLRSYKNWIKNPTK